MSVIDSFGAQINYGYDEIGRLKNVTGTAFAGVTQYATNLTYRAWGALKAMSYGTADGAQLQLSYNSRRQVSHFEDGTLMAADYQYFQDGRISFADDLKDDRFDRSYAYDHLGRLTAGRTGVAAHDPSASSVVPYNQTYDYDVWSNLMSRSNMVWSYGDSYATTYILQLLQRNQGLTRLRKMIMARCS